MTSNSQMDAKMEDEGVLSPEVRLRMISDVGNSVEVDVNVPARRYYKSGLEMVRMANVYLEEGSLENAFSLYIKFMTLFLEKIRAHPEFPSVSPEVRAINSQRLREVLPKAEKLKAQLLEQYQKEYDRYLKDKKRRIEQERIKAERDLAEHKRLAAANAAARNNDVRNRTFDANLERWSTSSRNVTPVPPLPDDLQYPSDALTRGSVREDKVPLVSPAIINKIDGRPGVDRSNKPSSLLSQIYSSKHALRSVIVPGCLMHKFLLIAHGNTEQNKETCGILGGVLENNRLLITHLLVPQQRGKPDACITQNEEEIFDYQDQNELVTFGWIHTHPTQTAFLSSVDLHTHCSYQRLMPEAIAVVCAPKYKDNNFYCLTPTYGLDYVASCRQTGFHPHPTEPPLYMIAEHVKLDNLASLKVVDFRR